MLKLLIVYTKYDGPAFYAISQVCPMRSGAACHFPWSLTDPNTYLNFSNGYLAQPVGTKLLWVVFFLIRTPRTSVRKGGVGVPCPSYVLTLTTPPYVQAPTPLFCEGGVGALCPPLFSSYFKVENKFAWAA